MFFELATLTVRFGTAAKANAAIKSYCEAPEAVSYTHLTLPTNREV